VDTPEDTLLVVLQVVSAMLTLLMFVTAWQTRQRRGPALWVIAFAISAVTQLLREGITAKWGHLVGLPIGHFGGPLAYALLYIGIRRYLGLPMRIGFATAGVALAATLTLLAISRGMTFASLALTATVTSMFQALTALTFWQAWRVEHGVARLSASTVFALSAIASMARAISVVPAWHVESGLVQANVYWLLVFIALNILQAGSLMFLVNQSLLDELQNMADFDPLTGLLNRRGFARRMKRHRPRSGGPARVGMLCMDLDHFKTINDVHGHGAGDDVLRRIGQLLRDNTRPNDTPVRQGGEEFAMIVEASSDDELRALAERHRAAIEREPFSTRVGPIPVTISIGAALSVNAVETLEEIGERADQALLAAKREGRNRVVVAPTRGAAR
jgi:diguanylate cyclase (GGDEF)-like protein